MLTVRSVQMSDYGLYWQHKARGILRNNHELTLEFSVVLRRLFWHASLKATCVTNSILQRRLPTLTQAASLTGTTKPRFGIKQQNCQNCIFIWTVELRHTLLLSNRLPINVNAEKWQIVTKCGGSSTLICLTVTAYHENARNSRSNA